MVGAYSILSLHFSILILRLFHHAQQLQQVRSQATFEVHFAKRNPETPKHALSIHTGQEVNRKQLRFKSLETVQAFNH